MTLYRAALAAAVVVLGAIGPARAAVPVSLDEAFRRVVDSHPELAAFAFEERSLLAERERAAQRPQLELAASAENFAGTGAYSGTHGVEATLSLASVLERGGKREARVAVADRRLDALALQREAKRLDLLAEVARRYLDAAGAVALEEVAASDVAQRRLAVDAAARRVAEGGAHASVQLQAEAALAKAQGARARAASAAVFARQRLAAMWGSRDASFAVEATRALALPPNAPPGDQLEAIADSPEIRQFATEARLREARVQLATTARSVDPAWEVGVRRLEADDDWGLVARVTIPFGTRERAAPAVRAAEAELAAIELEREGRERALAATLLEAASRLEASVLHANHIDTELLPRMEAASAALERAFRAGAASYLEWAQLRAELVATRRERIEAGIAAQRALIEVQRLTGRAFDAPSTTIQEVRP